MAINFKKRECQIHCALETCRQQGLPSNSNDFDYRNLEILGTNIAFLTDACQQDAVGFYYNALISFVEGCDQLQEKQYSWAIVKLYYSVYYCARAQMGFHNLLVLRKDNTLYDLHIMVGMKPHKCKGKNDHLTIIDLYKKEYASNYILSNTINGDIFTDYMMELRDTTHYKQQSMKEPYRLDVFEELNARIKSGMTIAGVLKEWLTDRNYYCFQEDCAYLVTTYVMLLETATQYKGQPNRMSTGQSKYIKKILAQSKMMHFVSDLLC